MRQVKHAIHKHSWALRLWKNTWAPPWNFQTWSNWTICSNTHPNDQKPWRHRHCKDLWYLCANASKCLRRTMDHELQSCEVWRKSCSRSTNITASCEWVSALEVLWAALDSGPPLLPCPHFANFVPTRNFAIPSQSATVEIYGVGTLSQRPKTFAKRTRPPHTAHSNFAPVSMCRTSATCRLQGLKLQDTSNL